MWTLIFTVLGCCSAGSSGTAAAYVPGFKTEAGCVATAKALERKHGDSRYFIWHCAKVAA